MNFLPTPSGSRPRLACEIAPQGVVAARAEDGATALAAVARVSLAAGAVAPSLKPGNIADRMEVIAAIRKCFEDIGAKPGARSSEVTVVIPDAAARVLLLDFDTLPNKLSEAMPIVRFRLKKLLPFDADDAMLSYQVMSSARDIVRVLAVAIPRDVLADYETAVREAGYEPGAVLPSTLACIAALDDAEPHTLLVNATAAGITTAIVRGTTLLLHRTVDLQPTPHGAPGILPPALFEGREEAAISDRVEAQFGRLPLVDVHDTASEWAAQEPLPEHGRNPYATAASEAEAAVQDEDGVIPALTDVSSRPERSEMERPAFGAAPSSEPAPIAHSPYTGPTVLADLNAESHNSILLAPTSMRDFAAEAAREQTFVEVVPLLRVHDAPAPLVVDAPLSNTSRETDIAEAVNVAAAYFEDTLSQMPGTILSAGPMGAEKLQSILAAAGDGSLRVRELVASDALLADAATAAVPRSWLSAVRGALNN